MPSEIFMVLLLLSDTCGGQVDPSVIQYIVRRKPCQQHFGKIFVLTTLPDDATIAAWVRNANDAQLGAGRPSRTAAKYANDAPFASRTRNGRATDSGQTAAGCRYRSGSAGVASGDDSAENAPSKLLGLLGAVV